MSKASRPAQASAESRIERSQHWIAVLASALVHVLFVLLLLWSSPVTVSSPQGTAGGSRMAVDFIGETRVPVSPVPPTRPVKPAATRPAASRVQSTPVPQAKDPVPPNFVDETTHDLAEAPASTPAVPTTPTPPQRRSRNWGQPPGLLPENTASENAGLARSASTDRGRRNDAAFAAPSMEVDGYQVYYDQRSESLLRAWRDQGMTEIFLPLPGTRRYMVCPLETALRRESGPCRLLEPDSSELATIGDAREVIDMRKVFRLGEPVWTGPGAYK